LLLLLLLLLCFEVEEGMVESEVFYSGVWICCWSELRRRRRLEPLLAR
jgi:hypothetical protein